MCPGAEDRGRRFARLPWRHDRRSLPAPQRTMGWYKVTDGRVIYAGRISREPYATWVATKAGSDAIATVAKGIGFRLLGRARAARTRVWRDLSAAARSEDGRV